MWRWLGAARYVWRCLGVIAIALLICLHRGAGEPLIRLTGLLLQLLGIGTVAWGISETRALFGHPPFMRVIKNWLENCPLRRSVVVSATGTATLGALTGRGRGYGMHGTGPNPTIQDRLDAIEKNLQAIHDRITQTQNEADAGFNRVEDLVKSEQHARQSSDRSIQEKLEATGTGGVHISAMGAAWLFVGMTLSTAAIEISAALG